jgi:uncharacterized protein (TIGR02679 family)
MSAPNDDRLRRLLGGERLAALRQRLRQRFERGPLDEHVESFRIGKLSADEHAALASLLGRAPRFAGSMQFDVRIIDAALGQAGIAASLRDALEQLDGPIIHTATARSRLRTLWSEVVEDGSHPGLTEFLRAPAGIGLVKRLSSQSTDAAKQLRRRAESVLRRLPANGITRAQLAASALGDAHALDNGRPVATLVLAVWRQARAAAHPEAEGTQAATENQSDIRQETGGERARDVWASAGVLVNELARPALFLNLPTPETGSYGQPAGEPAYASLRTLLRTPPRWAVSGREVYVCENPNLLAIAADRLGPSCSPLVCTDGMPAAAQRTLLTQLTRAGAHLRYHGDFDWPGLRIGHHVIREYGAQPWRFGAVNYVTAVQTAARPGHGLEGPEVVASWDEALSPAMQRHQLSIAEESVANSLLQELAGESEKPV